MNRQNKRTERSVSYHYYREVGLTSAHSKLKGDVQTCSCFHAHIYTGYVVGASHGQDTSHTHLVKTLFYSKGSRVSLTCFTESR